MEWIQAAGRFGEGSGIPPFSSGGDALSSREAATRVSWSSGEHRPAPAARGCSTAGGKSPVFPLARPLHLEPVVSVSAAVPLPPWERLDFSVPAESRSTHRFP